MFIFAAQAIVPTHNSMMSPFIVTTKTMDQPQESVNLLPFSTA